MRNRLGVAFDEEDNPPPLDFSDIEAKYQARFPGVRLPTTAPRDGVRERARYSDEQLGATLLLIEGTESSLGAHQAGRLLARVKDDIRALGGPSRYASGLRVGFAGNIAVSHEELSALSADLGKSSALVVIAVLVAIAAREVYRGSRGLALEQAEGPQLALGGDDLLHAAHPQRADQLRLEVLVAGEEAEPLHVLAAQGRPQPCSLEAARHRALLTGVVERRDAEPGAAGPEALERTAHRLGAADRLHGDAGRGQIEPAALCQREKRVSVALALHEHDDPYSPSVDLPHIRRFAHGTDPA